MVKNTQDSPTSIKQPPPISTRRPLDRGSTVGLLNSTQKTPKNVSVTVWQNPNQEKTIRMHGFTSRLPCHRIVVNICKLGHILGNYLRVTD